MVPKSLLKLLYLRTVTCVFNTKYPDNLSSNPQELSLGGFQIIRKANDQETLFKFHRTVKLEPGAVTTVWSADAGAEHEPPLNIVMKGQKWFVADNFTTQLLNTDQEVCLFICIFALNSVNGQP